MVIPVPEQVRLVRTRTSPFEILLTGGLFGGLAIIIYAAVALRALATSRVPGEKKNQGSAVVSLLAVFALAGWFLSLNYSSILWLPLVLVLAHRDNTRE